MSAITRINADEITLSFQGQPVAKKISDIPKMKLHTARVFLDHEINKNHEDNLLNAIWGPIQTLHIDNDFFEVDAKELARLNQGLQEVKKDAEEHSGKNTVFAALRSALMVAIV